MDIAPPVRSPCSEYPKIGTVVELFGVGVLLSGPSGVGKSELALGLLDRGHALVVDDGPEFYIESDHILMARCPIGFEGLLEVRGIGIVDVVQLYGEWALKASTRVALIIELSAAVNSLSADGGRINRVPHSVFINTIELPLLELAVSPGRNLPLWVEVAVKQQLAAL